MMKATVAYKKGDAYYLHSSSKTTAGVWIATAPFLKIEMNSTPSTKGEAVLQVDASHDVIPHPTNWAGLISPLLELAGVKSWATFMKHAKCLNVEADGERLRLIPNRNLGSKEGFSSPLLKKPSSCRFHHLQTRRALHLRRRWVFASKAGLGTWGDLWGDLGSNFVSCFLAGHGERSGERSREVGVRPGRERSRRGRGQDQVSGFSLASRRLGCYHPEDATTTPNRIPGSLLTPSLPVPPVPLEKTRNLV